MQNMKTHWVADMYPLNEEDVAALAEDIKANGQIAPILALKDGRIIDGRNRWLACHKAGVEPMMEIINPNGEQVAEEKLFSMATSCNSMRRDMTTSLRACLAAEAWKKLYPEGAPKTGKVRTDSDLTYIAFAKKAFKASRDPAKQALAILNHDPSGELMAQAKDSLSKAYSIYEQEKIQRLKERENREILDRHPDLKEQVANGMSVEEALVLCRHREAERVQHEEAMLRRQSSIVDAVRSFQQMTHMHNGLDAKEVRSWMNAKTFAGTFEGVEAERQTLEKGITLLSGILEETK
jgi:hypothetical protein